MPGKWMLTKRATISGRGTLRWGEHLNSIPCATPRLLSCDCLESVAEKDFKVSSWLSEKGSLSVSNWPLCYRPGESHRYRSPCPWPSWYALSLEPSPNSHAKFMVNLIRGTVGNICKLSICHFFPPECFKSCQGGLKATWTSSIKQKQTKVLSPCMWHGAEWLDIRINKARFLSSRRWQSTARENKSKVRMWWEKYLYLCLYRMYIVTR